MMYKNNHMKYQSLKLYRFNRTTLLIIRIIDVKFSVNKAGLAAHSSNYILIIHSL